MAEENYSRVHPFCRIPVIHPALLFDDCESTFLWNTDGTGTDWTAEHDPTAAHVQTNGILLKTKSTTPAANDKVLIDRKLWLPPQKLLRLQLVFAHPVVANAAHLRFVLHWYEGETHYVSGLRSQPDLGEVAYASGIVGIEPTWTVMPEPTLPISDGVWNKLDFSVNWQTARHHLLHLNEHAQDVSAIAIASVGAVTATVLQLYIELETLINAQAVAYIDQVLLTPENP